MRLGILPESLTDRLALLLNRVPTPLGDGLFGMMACRSLMAGVRAGIFRDLAAGPAAVADLAERLDLDPAALDALAGVLVAGGYLSRDGRSLGLTPAARRWLNPASRQYVGHLIEFNYDHWEWWSRLDPVLRTGEPLDLHGTLSDPASWRRYVLAMRDLARLCSVEIAAAVPIRPAARRLLDLGGAHGEYALALCRRHPGLEATVVDLPAAAAIGADLMAGTDLGGRLRFQSADVTRDVLGAGYDIVLIFQILHHFPADQARALLRRAVDALRPGGLIAVLEPVQAGRADQLGAVLHLHYLLTSRGEVLTRAALRRRVREAGCARVRSRPLRSLPGLQIVIGTKGSTGG